MIDLNHNIGFVNKTVLEKFPISQWTWGNCLNYTNYSNYEKNCIIVKLGLKPIPSCLNVRELWPLLLYLFELSGIITLFDRFFPENIFCNKSL